MKRGKAVPSGGLEMSVGERIKEVEGNGHKYLLFNNIPKSRKKRLVGDFCRKIFGENNNNHEKYNGDMDYLSRYGACIIKDIKNELDETDIKTRTI